MQTEREPIARCIQSLFLYHHIEVNNRPTLGIVVTVSSVRTITYCIFLLLPSASALSLQSPVYMSFIAVIVFICTCFLLYFICYSVIRLPSLSGSVRVEKIEPELSSI